jgi:hopene-associated glycosyltransferase HpnB
MDATDRVRVVTTPPLPQGWSGKLWAQSQAIAAAERDFPDTELLLLSDADICHAPEQLRHMVARLLDKGLDMASLMVRLSTDTRVEKAIVPAFVYFFRLLYPFRWVSNPLRRTAAAAGGYMLIRRRMLSDIGGLAAIRGALIDDCTLAATIKAAAGHIALDMTETTVSSRTYASWRDLWMMIARSAYTQLRHSPLLLAGTIAAMTVAFLLPPLFVLSGGAAAGPALLAWILMSISFAPTLAFYRLPAAWAPLLPAVALFYLGATLDSARRHGLGRGGEWKGRVQGAAGSEGLPK